MTHSLLQILPSQCEKPNHQDGCTLTMKNKFKQNRRHLKRSLREAVRLLRHTPEIRTRTGNSDSYWLTRKGGKFDSRLNSYQQFRADWILEHIQEGATVLDVASGEGKILSYLTSRKKLKAIPTENSHLCIEHLKSLGFSPEYMDLSDPSFDENIGIFDHIILCEILEHLPNPEMVLTKFVEKSKISVFFSVPNTGYFPYRLRLLFGRFPMQWRSHPSEHLRFWTLADMKWWLQQLKLDNKTTITLYEGVPLLNKVFPSLFAAAMILKIDTKESDLMG